MMRIALVGPFGLRPKMTMARRALPLARALAARGHSVRILLPPWDWPEDSGKTWQEDGVEVVNVQLRPSLPLARHLIISVRLLRSLLAFSPDIAHCFKPKAYAGIVALCMRVMQRLRLWRGQLVVDADDWEGPAGWNAAGDYSWWQQRFFAWQELWGLSHCDAVTVASRWLEQRAALIRGSWAQVWRLPNGVGQTVENPGLTSARAPTVLFYTRFVECGPTQVASVWREVCATIPAARLVVAGAGLRGEEHALADLLAAEGLDDHVQLLGWVDSAELPGVFRASDVAMLPLEDSVLVRAKCPARLLDMMAAGIPVVTHAVGEYAEIVEDGISGLVVPPGDHSALAAAVVTLLEDGGLRRDMGSAAQRRVRTAFSWDRLAEQLDHFYATWAAESNR